jgi:hypothetical protein
VSQVTLTQGAAELGVSGADHLFLSWNTLSFAGTGVRVNTFGPCGLSGGALLDLGEFASPESFERDAGGSLLTGMIIEYHEEHRALVAVKIRSVIAGIGRALAQRELTAKR